MSRKVNDKIIDKMAMINYACFMKKEVKNSKFPDLSAEVSRLKETKEGVQAVCEVMERYENIAANKAVKIANVQKVVRMLEKNYPKEEILDLGYTEEVYWKKRWTGGCT